jgi:hypothetical protein
MRRQMPPAVDPAVLRSLMNTMLHGSSGESLRKRILMGEYLNGGASNEEQINQTLSCHGISTARRSQEERAAAYHVLAVDTKFTGSRVDCRKSTDLDMLCWLKVLRA